jgi:hypothetical protein
MKIIFAALLCWGVLAADEPKKEMPPDEPMASKMPKKGMKKGDVKKDAEEKQRQMKPMLDKEQKSMETKGRDQ